jgi:hypothetical protein
MTMATSTTNSPAIAIAEIVDEAMAKKESSSSPPIKKRKLDKSFVADVQFVMN